MYLTRLSKAVLEMQRRKAAVSQMQWPPQTPTAGARDLAVIEGSTRLRLRGVGRGEGADQILFGETAGQRCGC